MSDYELWIRQKSQLDGYYGFDPSFMPDYLFGFQKAIIEWAIKKGRAATFADCGLGKTLMELVWAQNVVNQTGKPVLILTPLAVAMQFAKEANKFGIEASRSERGEINTPIVITNYERLHLFNSDDFAGVVCDESSILKSFDGMRKQQITDFMRKKEYRLLGTATAAPNDFTELGTSSEALGYLGYMDMLSRFFTNKNNTSHGFNGRWSADDKWRFKGHAEQKFWQWVSSWARALRKPSDMGFANDGFDLPKLTVNEHVIAARQAPEGMLFNVVAINRQEELAERRRTIQERCEKAAELVNGTGQPATVWCQLNDEGDLLESLIHDAVQVSGKDNDDSKEEKFKAFSDGEIRVLITKPKIGAWGLNWQHCAHTVYFPSHSYEQLYQAVRRHWRFGQTNEVVVDHVLTEGQVRIQENLQRKADQAAEMFTELVAHMNDAIEVDRLFQYNKPVEVPKWLS
jgi:hypothetical protein